MEKIRAGKINIIFNYVCGEKSRNSSNESFDINPSNQHQILSHSKEEQEAGMEKRREKGNYSLRGMLCQLYQEEESF